MIADKLASLGMREKVGLAIAVIGVAVAVLDRTAIEYVEHQFRILRESVQKENERLLENQEFVRSGRLRADEYRRVRKFLPDTPAGTDVVGRLRADIDELAGEAGLSILSIKHRETRASRGGYYEECFIEIEKFEAGIRELLTFLHRLSTSPKMLRVERLTLAPQADGQMVSGSMSIGKIVVVSNAETGESSGASLTP